MESIDTKAFWNSVCDGTTAQIYVELMLSKLQAIKSQSQFPK